MTPLREARIDLGALVANLGILRDTVAPAQVMGVVKAQGYGHGAVGVARALADAGIDWLGVADLAEALELRQAGIRTPLLAWLHGPDLDAAAAVAHDIDLGVSTIDQLELAAAAGATVHLKLDTGLSRNGFSPTDAITAFARAADHECGGRLRVRGIFSHLSNTSPDDDAAQTALFAELGEAAREAGLAPELRHLAATQAALTRPDARLDLVRLGIGLYGIEYGDAADPAALGLKPVMELAGTVAAVRRVPAGTGMSYGFLDRTDRDTTLALVPLGYADGIPRAASGKATVSINGQTFRQVGRIAMDQFLVDVGDAPVHVGDRVVLWGDPATGVPSASDWAHAADTIGYEIVTRVGPRVARTFLDDTAVG